VWTECVGLERYFNVLGLCVILVFIILKSVVFDPQFRIAFV
jgi:hypothetical protein